MCIINMISIFYLKFHGYSEYGLQIADITCFRYNQQLYPGLPMQTSDVRLLSFTAANSSLMSKIGRKKCGEKPQQ